MLQKKIALKGTEYSISHFTDLLQVIKAEFVGSAIGSADVINSAIRFWKDHGCRCITSDSAPVRYLNEPQQSSFHSGRNQHKRVFHLQILTSPLLMSQVTAGLDSLRGDPSLCSALDQEGIKVELGAPAEFRLAALIFLLEFYRKSLADSTTQDILLEKAGTMWRRSSSLTREVSSRVPPPRSFRETSIGPSPSQYFLAAIPSSRSSTISSTTFPDSSDLIKDKAAGGRPPLQPPASRKPVLSSDDPHRHLISWRSRLREQQLAESRKINESIRASRSRESTPVSPRNPEPDDDEDRLDLKSKLAARNLYCAAESSGPERDRFPWLKNRENSRSTNLGPSTASNSIIRSDSRQRDAVNPFVSWRSHFKLEDRDDGLSGDRSKEPTPIRTMTRASSHLRDLEHSNGRMDQHLPYNSEENGSISSSSSRKSLIDPQPPWRSHFEGLQLEEHQNGQRVGLRCCRNPVDPLITEREIARDRINHLYLNQKRRLARDANCNLAPDELICSTKRLPGSSEDLKAEVQSPASKRKCQSSSGYDLEKSQAKLLTLKERSDISNDIRSSYSQVMPPEHRPLPGFDSGSAFGQSQRAKMGIDCDEVFPNIILGNGATLKNKDYLKRIGVTHILNVAEYRGVNISSDFFSGSDDFTYMGIRVEDTPQTQLCRYFTEAADFINSGLVSGGKVFVNCVYGKSRSATCVVAYLSLFKDWSPEFALKHIRQKRPINPNYGFVQQLVDLDNHLNWFRNQQKNV